MQGISGIILMIIVACLLPYVFTLIAKSKGGFQAKDNQNPREFLAKTRFEIVQTEMPGRRPGSRQGGAASARDDVSALFIRTARRLAYG